MKITKLEKKKRLYLLELDQKETLYVTEDTIVRFFLSRDKTVTAEELEEIKTFAQFSYGKNLALYHLSFKQRTVKEVRDYLTKHEIEPAISQQVIAHLSADKWLDDAAYTQQMIDNNLHSGDKGPLALQQKLAQKGIDKHLSSQLLDQADFTPVAQRLAEKTLRKHQGKHSHRSLLDKLTQTLLQKGFSYSTAKQTIHDLDIEEDPETTQDLLFAELDKAYHKYSRKYEGYELKQRLTQYLARKGYDFSDIAQAIKEYE